MHWPCVTDFSGLSTYGLNGYEREMSTPPTLRRGTVDLPFALLGVKYMYVHGGNIKGNINL